MRALLLPFLLTAVIGTTACDDDDDPITPAGGVTLVVGQQTASVRAGDSTTVPITITRTNGFSGSVTLTAENVPTGMTATFEPASLSSTANTSNMKLNATSTATTGGTITVRASGAGVSPQTATLPVTITTTPTP